ncbi:MAG: formate--tetrahydrofolate ligase [Deltaproteobacteria bacterium]|nr:formate--tetrahydrofolate ligase [Deltaproteobacteria bacterium]
MKDIVALAAELGLPAAAVEVRGRGVAKIDPEKVSGKHGGREVGRVVLVTAMTPTPAGEGKTTTTIGLVDGLRKQGVHAVGALREPSLGPLFGLKGGAVGGGKARVIPDDAINLHFTGDLHAVTSAHNLLAAVAENHAVCGHEPRLDKITWGRALDMNDRGLRTVEVGASNKAPYKSRFDITAASEVMAVLCLSRDFDDLRARLDRIVVGAGPDGSPVTAKAVRASGAMAAILLDAARPNLVQTLEGNPVFVHGGPFANVAQGTSTLIQTQLARRVADVVVTEAGFAFDLGGFKFLDLKCRAGGLRPAAVVLVGTVRALRFHGGKKDYGQVDVDAVTRGLDNVVAHVESMARLGLPRPVFSLNRFPDDDPAEVAAVSARLDPLGVTVVQGRYFADGGAGAVDLADAVMARLAATPDDSPGYTAPYALDAAIHDKVAAVARVVLGAQGAALNEKAQADLALVQRLGGAGLPVCLAKTHLSISDDAKVQGRPGEFSLTVTGLRLSAGAGFVVALCGSIVTMPGLPKEPQAWLIDVVKGDDGVRRIVGIK